MGKEQCQAGKQRAVMDQERKGSARLRIACSWLEAQSKLRGTSPPAPPVFHHHLQVSHCPTLPFPVSLALKCAGSIESWQRKEFLKLSNLRHRLDLGSEFWAEILQPSPGHALPTPPLPHCLCTSAIPQDFRLCGVLTLQTVFPGMLECYHMEAAQSKSYREKCEWIHDLMGFQTKGVCAEAELGPSLNPDLGLR